MRFQPGQVITRRYLRHQMNRILEIDTAEHGVGLLERGGMRRELSPSVLAMQQAVEQTLDPLNLFNPGKVVGDPAE